MNVKINGRPETIGKVSSIADLVTEKGLAPEKIVVEHNYRIVPREEWVDVNLRQDDNIEIVSFVGGG